MNMAKVSGPGRAQIVQWLFRWWIENIEWGRKILSATTQNLVLPVWFSAPVFNCCRSSWTNSVKWSAVIIKQKNAGGTKKVRKKTTLEQMNILWVRGVTPSCYVRVGRPDWFYWGPAKASVAQLSFNSIDNTQVLEQVAAKREKQHWFSPLG